MRNWKTSFFGFIAAVSFVLNGVVVVGHPKLTAIITGISLLCMAISAKDRNVTGGTIQQ